MRQKNIYKNPSKYSDIFNHDTFESKLEFIKKYISDDSNIDNYLIDSLYWDIKCSKSSRPNKDTNQKHKFYGDKLKHKQIHVFNPFYNEIINVDEKICKLLVNLWKNDINTDNSCESNVPDDYIWISFSSCDDFERFINQVINWLNENNPEDRDRILDHEFKSFDCWDYKINAYDDDDYLDITCSVRFPWYDLEWVEKVFESN